MKRLGDLLLELGWISTTDLRRALELQSSRGGRLGTCLLECRAVDEGRLTSALANQLGVEAAKPRDFTNIPDRVLSALEPRFALRNSAIPFRLLGSDLWIALRDPANLLLVDELAFASGQHIRPYAVPEFRLELALSRYYEHSADPRFEDLRRQLEHRHGSSEEAATQTIPSEDTKTTQPFDLPAPPPGYTTTGGIVVPRGTTGSRSPTLEKALAGLHAARDLDSIGQVLTDYLARRFERVAIFTLRSDHASGWMGDGVGFDAPRLASLRIGYDEPSVFLNLHRGGSFWVGPLPPMNAHRRLDEAWSGSSTRECLIHPIDVGGRRVAAVYCAPGRSGFRRDDLEELSLLTGHAGEALADLILRRKKSASRGPTR